MFGGFFSLFRPNLVFGYIEITVVNILGFGVILGWILYIEVSKTFKLTYIKVYDFLILAFLVCFLDILPFFSPISIIV